MQIPVFHHLPQKNSLWRPAPIQAERCTAPAVCGRYSNLYSTLSACSQFSVCVYFYYGFVLRFPCDRMIGCIRWRDLSGQLILFSISCYQKKRIFSPLFLAILFKTVLSCNSSHGNSTCVLARVLLYFQLLLCSFSSACASVPCCRAVSAAVSEHPADEAGTSLQKVYPCHWGILHCLCIFRLHLYRYSRLPQKHSVPLQSALPAPAPAGFPLVSPHAPSPNPNHLCRKPYHPRYCFPVSFFSIKTFPPVTKRFP